LRISAAADRKPRATQNVVFERGLFISALGPERVAPLVSGGIEFPSDYEGVVYISLDRADWRQNLAKERRIVRRHPLT
jgi:predicted nucleotide-binding protein